MTRRTRLLTALGTVALVSAGGIGAVGVNAADHLDAPSVAADGRTDINDVYAFQSPSDANKTVLVMTVNPVAGVLSGTTFHPKATYRINIDDNGDAVEDTTLDFTFQKVDADGSQEVALKVRGAMNGKKTTKGKGSVGDEIAIESGGRFTAGLYDDPFFFDLEGFRNGFQFTGANFFKGLNVSAIVAEVPSSLLGTDGVGVWATTMVGGSIIDQMGRPAINTALISSARKEEFNTTPPSAQRAAFRTDVVAAITGLSGDAAYAEAITDVLIPDVLTFDLGNAGGFLNGRRLADDVIDAELNVLTKGALTTDGTPNDSAFTNNFPYLAPAN